MWYQTMLVKGLQITNHLCFSWKVLFTYFCTCIKDDLGATNTQTKRCIADTRNHWGHSVIYTLKSLIPSIFYPLKRSQFQSYKPLLRHGYIYLLQVNLILYNFLYTDRSSYIIYSSTYPLNGFWKHGLQKMVLVKDQSCPTEKIRCSVYAVFWA